MTLRDLIKLTIIGMLLVILIYYGCLFVYDNYQEYQKYPHLNRAVEREGR